MLAPMLMELFKASTPRLSLSPFMAQDCVGGPVGFSGAVKSSLPIVCPAMMGGVSVPLLLSECVMPMIEALRTKSIRWCVDIGLAMRAARQVSP